MSRVEKLLKKTIYGQGQTDPPLSRNEELLTVIANDLLPGIRSEINELESIGRYLSLWDCTTGKPETFPRETPYAYNSGDYYIISKTGSTNYKPEGTTYTGQASATPEEQNVEVQDYYYFDGTQWKPLHKPKRVIKTQIDNPVKPNYSYYLGVQSTLAINMPTNATLGDDILVCFTSGSTACMLTCSLTGFDFTPKANKTSWLKFTLYHKQDTAVVGDTDLWLVETKEG